MTTIVKFTRFTETLYQASIIVAEGEYVPLPEHQALKTHMESLAKETYELKGLIRRVVELLPHTYDYQQLESEDIKQLLADCQGALK